MIITIVGTGLIGGSMAIALRKKGIADTIIGVDTDPDHRQKALERGLVDEVAALDEAVDRAALVIVAIPVQAARNLIPRILDRVDKQVVMDVSSTKGSILEAIADHPRRNRFIATHPMWGTEYSGPEAAVDGAFEGKVTVISGYRDCDPDAIKLVEDIYRELGMRVLHMEAKAHDLHAAYVSHISHITSFALANTVLEKEKVEAAIFAMASAGFESTVRLAKSNPAMWTQIFMENRKNVLDVLGEHITQLEKFRECLEKADEICLSALIGNANKIRKILK